MFSRKLKKGIIIATAVFVILFIGEEFVRRVLGGLAGSYPFAESWNIAAKESDVIKAIESLKSDNPNLKPPKDSSFRYSYWYYADFYYLDTRQTVHAWTRPGTNEFTTDLAFVSISNSYNKEDKLINKDFWYLANRREINKFKRLIVDKLEQKLYSSK